MIVEILIILYLTSLKEHIEVIMKIVSLTVVVQLDTYYANSISANPIKKANLLKLEVEFKRYFIFENLKI